MVQLEYGGSSRQSKGELVQAPVISLLCLSSGYYCCCNTTSKKQVGEEKVYLAYASVSLFITEEVRTGAQTGLELEGRS